MTSPLNANPACQLSDELIVGGVVTTIGVGQEELAERAGGSFAAVDQL
ncbi:MAG: hypothetical protein ACRDS1_10080 [Pseudonocardiaceae bacterium]